MTRKRRDTGIVLGPDGQDATSIPAVAGVHPTSNRVLIELLTAQEIMRTRFTLSGNDTEGKMGPHQAYVREVGPACDNEKRGFQVGDRVIISTVQAVPAPRPADSHRDWMIVDPDAIRAVLDEE